MRRVGTAHHYRVCADTPYSRSKGEEWIDRMITQGFFPSPTLRKGRRMGHPCAWPGRSLALPHHHGTSTARRFCHEPCATQSIALRATVLTTYAVLKVGWIGWDGAIPNSATGFETVWVIVPGVG